MALGDLLAADYQVEFNDLLLGPNTSYYLTDIDKLLGFNARSGTTSRFGRHGGVPGRHYAMNKVITIKGEIATNSESSFDTLRRNFGAAFAPVVESTNAPYLAIRLPDGSSGRDLRVRCRPIEVDFPLTPQYARLNPEFTVRLEVVNPIIEALTLKSQVFTVASDTETIANDGNAPAYWTGTLVGPAVNPILTHVGTSQVVSFSSLTLSGSDTLVYESIDSRVELNGSSNALTLASGFSWFELSPGNNSISISATSAGSATFTLTWRDSYWIP